MEIEEYFLMRCKKRIKQNILAQAINVSPSLICKFEQGKTTMSDSNVDKYKQFIVNH